MNLPPVPLRMERRVDFSQTDAAGILHFSTYFVYMEAAEAELFRQLGLKLLWNEGGSLRGFPRIDCAARFRRPVGFDDLIRIELTLSELVANRLHYAFEFFGPDGGLCATGTLVTACALRAPDGSLQSAPLPDAYRAALLAWKNQAG